MIDQNDWALTAFENSSRILLRAKCRDELITGVCGEITKHYPYVLAWVGVPEDDQEKTIRILGASGEQLSYIQDIKVTWDSSQPSGQGPAGLAITTGKTQVMLDSETESRYAPWLDRARAHGIRSCVSIPFAYDNKVIGLLVIYASVPEAFTSVVVRLFQSLANGLGTGMMALADRDSLEQERQSREATQKRLIEALEMTIAALATAMEMRDPYTSGHLSKVAKLSEAIAKEMGWDEDRVQGLRMAAMVHDIGKLAVPTDLLTKPSKLSPIEYEFIKEHVNSSFTILKDIPFEQPVAEIVLQHHELMDGTGYPRGLRGDDILPEARVLVVANKINSLCSHRPYRAAITLDRAMEKLLEQAGHQLDANVVQSAKRLFDRQVLQSIIN